MIFLQHRDRVNATLLRNLSSSDVQMARRKGLLLVKLVMKLFLHVNVRETIVLLD